MAQENGVQERTKEITGTYIQDRVSKLMAGKSFKEIADNTGIDQSTIRRIISGDRGASASTIAQLAANLHTTTSFLLGETDCENIYFLKYDKNILKDDRKDYPVKRELLSSLLEQYSGTLRYCVYEGGEAMAPRYRNQDVLVYAKWRQLHDRQGTIQNPVINGDVAVVKYRGRVLVRGYFEEHEGVVLRAFNPSFNDIKVLEDDDFEIIGKVVCILPAPKQETGFF